MWLQPVMGDSALDQEWELDTPVCVQVAKQALTVNVSVAACRYPLHLVSRFRSTSQLYCLISVPASRVSVFVEPSSLTPVLSMH